MSPDLAKQRKALFFGHSGTSLTLARQQAQKSYRFFFHRVLFLSTILEAPSWEKSGVLQKSYSGGTVIPWFPATGSQNNGKFPKSLRSG